MVNMDTRLPLLVQQPDIVNALAMGTRAAADQANVLRAAEGQNIFRQHGAAAMQGNQNALAAIAGFDPVMAQGMDMNRQENARADARLGLDRERLELTRTQTALAVKNAQDKADAESQVRMMERAFRAADLGMQTGDEAAVRQALAMFGVEDLPVDEGMAYAAQYVAGGIEGLAGNYLPSEADSAAEQRISRILQANPGMTRAQAINIVDDVIQTDRDPLTRELGVVNLADYAMGQTPAMPPAAASPAVPSVPPTTPQGPLSFPDNQQFDNASQAFGAGAVVRNLGNTLADTAGLGMPFPETQQATDDFLVFKEGLVNSFASAYGRQPPSWLLQNIEALAPRPGQVFEGPGRAQSKIDALVRELTTRRTAIEQDMSSRRMDPTARSDLQGQIAGINAVMGQLEQARSGFAEPTSAAPITGDVPPPNAVPTPEAQAVMDRTGVTLEEMWPHLSPEARARAITQVAPMQGPSAPRPSRRDGRK